MKSNVALGDSISIDTYAGGPGRGEASLLARNRNDDFPQRSGLWVPETRLTPADLLLPCWRTPGMIRRWRCG